MKPLRCPNGHMKCSKSRDPVMFAPRHWRRSCTASCLGFQCCDANLCIKPSYKTLWSWTLQFSSIEVKSLNEVAFRVQFKRVDHKQERSLSDTEEKAGHWKIAVDLSMQMQYAGIRSGGLGSFPHGGRAQGFFFLLTLVAFLVLLKSKWRFCFLSRSLVIAQKSGE